MTSENDPIGQALDGFESALSNVNGIVTNIESGLTSGVEQAQMAGLNTALALVNDAKATLHRAASTVKTAAGK